MTSYEKWLLIHAAEFGGAFPLMWHRNSEIAARSQGDPELVAASRYRRALHRLDPGRRAEIFAAVAEVVAADEETGPRRFRVVLALVGLVAALGLGPWWLPTAQKIASALLMLAEGGSMGEFDWMGLLVQFLTVAGASGVLTQLARKGSRWVAERIPRSVWPLVSMVVGVATAFLAGLEPQAAVTVGAAGGMAASGAQASLQAAAKDARQGAKSTADL